MQRRKYPRTPHLPWSPGATSDDVKLSDCQHFIGKEVVVTEKLDGENTTIYHDGYVHARSTDSKHHPSRSWVKQFAASIYSLPQKWRLCGENMFAYHSIFYTQLPSYFLCFGIYDENNDVLSWEDAESICNMLDVDTAPVIYQGLWNEELIKAIWAGVGTFPTFAHKDGPRCEAEGYVVRLATSFAYDQFSECCGKFVRPHHVQTSEHWMQQTVVPNELRAN